MDRLQQKDAAYCIAGIEGFHVVAVGSPMPCRRQEHARPACLTALVGELPGFGVQHLVIEAGGPDLNRRDVATVQGPLCLAQGQPLPCRPHTRVHRVSHCCGLPT